MTAAICIVLLIVAVMVAIPRDIWSWALQTCLDQTRRLATRDDGDETHTAGNIVVGFMLGVCVLTTLIIGTAILLELFMTSPESGALHTKPPLEPNTEADYLQWMLLPIAIVIGLAIALTAVRLSSWGYTIAMDQLATARNRGKIAKYYLQTTAQIDQRWHRDGDGNKS